MTTTAKRRIKPAPTRLRKERTARDEARDERMKAVAREFRENPPVPAPIRPH